MGRESGLVAIVCVLAVCGFVADGLIDVFDSQLRLMTV